MVSEAFEGIDVLALDILVAKDGREIIHDANDVVPFLGDSQEEDRKAIADLIQSHIISRYILEASVAYEVLCILQSELALNL